jgi:hypothetical protein
VRALGAVAVLAMVLALPADALAAARTEELVSRAGSEYARSEYQRVIDILSPVVADPRALAELDEQRTLEVHRLLGLSYFFLAQTLAQGARAPLLDKAAAQFSALLFLEPDYTLDAALEGPDATAYFEEVRRDGRERLEKIRAQRRLDEERRRRPQVERLVERTTHDEAAWPNWMPGGVGQFRNGHTGKGAVILTLQLVSFGTSAGIYLSHAARYGWPIGQLPADPDETARIRREQYIQIAAGAVFLITYGVSVYDAYRYQRPGLSERTTVRPIPYDDAPASAPAQPPPTSLVPTIAPYVHAGGAGAVLTWEL